MIKGCVFKIFFIVIVAAGVLVYLFDKYAIPYYETSKQSISESLIDGFQKNVIDAFDNQMKDSLLTVLSNKIKLIKKKDTRDYTSEMDSLVTGIKNYLSVNAEKIRDKKNIEKIIEDYERGKKN